jgi:hypothetical protein
MQNLKITVTGVYVPQHKTVCSGHGAVVNGVNRIKQKIRAASSNS